MRILYFHQHFSTPQGATGTRSYEMAQALVRGGHEVVMVCGGFAAGKTGLEGSFDGGKRRGFVDGIEVIEFDLSYSNSDSFPRRTKTFLQYVWGAVRLAMTENYDVAFATTTPLTAGIPAIAARWLRRKRFVFEVRDLWPELPQAMGVITNPVVLWAMSALEWASYRSAHHCIALAPGIRDGIAKRGVDEHLISTIPNGCDLEIFAGASHSWRPSGVTSVDFLAIFTGTHGIANGLSSVLDAAQELQRRGREDIKLAFFGDGKLKPKLVEQAKQAGLNNVIFHSPIDKLTLSGLMAGADLGLQVLANVPAFYYGTSPNKFFDYISAGLPVLNNYPGWIADMIETENCGVVVPPSDPFAFADALEFAADNRERLRLDGKRARNLAKRNFDRRTLASHWVACVTGIDRA